MIELYALVLPTSQLQAQQLMTSQSRSNRTFNTKLIIKQLLFHTRILLQKNLASLVFKIRLNLEAAYFLRSPCIRSKRYMRMLLKLVEL